MLSMMNRYTFFLRTHPLVARLTIIQFMSYIGAWFSNVAIYTLLVEFGVSATTIATIAALHFIPGLIQAPFTGVVVDRVKPKKLMLTLMAVEILFTAMFLFITDVSLLWLLALIVIVRMSAASFYFTTEMALLPKLLQGDNLKTANEIHSIVWSVAFTLGMALSGMAVAMFGVKIAFLIDLGMFVGAFVLLLNLPLTISATAVSHSFATMMKQSLHYICKNRIIFHLIALHAFVALTAFDALVAITARDNYSAVITIALAIGFMHAARALGLAVGPMVLTRYISVRYLPHLFCLQSISVLFYAMVIDDFYLSLVAMFFIGLFTTSLWSFTYTLLQHHVEHEYYGRIVAYNDMLFLGTSALVSYVIGWLYDLQVTLWAIVVVIAVGFIIAMLYSWWIKKAFNLQEL